MNDKNSILHFMRALVKIRERRDEGSEITKKTRSLNSIPLWFSSSVIQIFKYICSNVPVNSTAPGTKAISNVLLGTCYSCMRQRNDLAFVS